MMGVTLGHEKPKVYDRQSDDLPINSIVAEAVVDDPIECGAKLLVLRSIRDDPLAGMHSRGQIDDAQLAAGRLWQRYHEHSEIGAVRAIDPTKEAVDGGRMADPISPRQMLASDEMAKAGGALGAYGVSIVYDVLARRMTIVEVAQARNMPRELEIKYIGRRFRECLETLAKLWGYA